VRLLNGIKFYRRFFLSNYDKYRRDGYDKLITLDLGLDKSSNVVEVGGYLGSWSSQIFELYKCNLLIFEPVPEYFAFLKEKFSQFENISLYNFGLSPKSVRVNFGLDGPGTGFSSVGEDVQVELRAVEDVIDILPSKIDLIAINIEGGEYSLIPEFQKYKLLDRCETIFIQFHRLDSKSKRQRQFCRKLLSKTHTFSWNYDFVWEAWEKKEL